MTENAVNLSSDEALIDVTKDLPPESEIAQLLAFAVEYWKPRNDWLDKLEALLRCHYRSKSLSVKDQILMDRIVETVNNADDRAALIEAISTSLS